MRPARASCSSSPWGVPTSSHSASRAESPRSRQGPALIDGGFRRGSDFFKALALGASAVCVGRPYLWGLAAFGQEGVEAVLAMLRTELEAIMRQMGTPSLGAITPAHVQAHGERAHGERG